MTQAPGWRIPDAWCQMPDTTCRMRNASCRIPRWRILC